MQKMDSVSFQFSLADKATELRMPLGKYIIAEYKKSARNFPLSGGKL
jgi:hypothetical protein